MNEMTCSRGGASVSVENDEPVQVEDDGTVTHRRALRARAELTNIDARVCLRPLRIRLPSSAVSDSFSCGAVDPANMPGYRVAK
jgi:hypothetical protein